MIELVKDLVCDHDECVSLLHFDKDLPDWKCLAIAVERYDWEWLPGEQAFCPKHRKGGDSDEST